MESRHSSTLLGLVALLTLFVSLLPVASAQWTQSYCSPLNTGSDTDVYSWPWQSNGNCTGHCNQEGTYAFAVLQFNDCWCSNYVPGDQEDISNCQVDCPGFPAEKCGNKDKGLYMYIQMDGKPSGTRGGSKPTTPAADPSTDAPSSKAPTQTEDAEPSSTMKTSAKPSPKPTDEPEPSTTEEPRTVPTVVTESGVIVTRTVVFTPSAAPVAESPQKETNVGAIAGGVVGGIFGLLAIVGGILFVLWRRRKQQAEQQGGQDGSNGISRNVSTMSRAGLLGGRSEKTPPPLVTTFGSQRSRTDDESVTPVTPSTRRLSQPILVDSRLNPNAVLTFHGANASRESFGSIDDSRDYGRQLNVRNPDP